MLLSPPILLFWVYLFLEDQIQNHVLQITDHMLVELNQNDYTTVHQLLETTFIAQS
jgi:hypothetical protein